MFVFNRIIKNFFDLSISIILLCLTLPIFIITSCLILLEDGMPIFFFQKRIGRNGQILNLIKFRSMFVNNIPVEEMGQVTASNTMITKTGRIIRRLKIDELPQIINVVKGDMSLVGPRPTIPEQIEKYTPYEMKRLEVKPGMTGWAQVNGNINLSWEYRILLDRWYIEHWSLWLDIRILIKTVGVILNGEHVNNLVIREAIANENSDSRSGC